MQTTVNKLASVGACFANLKYTFLDLHIKKMKYNDSQYENTTLYTSIVWRVFEMNLIGTRLMNSSVYKTIVR